jgi:hypothetical protein
MRTEINLLGEAPLRRHMKNASCDRAPARGSPSRNIIMEKRRFGRTAKLPSTLAIKHQMLSSMLLDEFMAAPSGAIFDGDGSPALRALRKLMQIDPTHAPKFARVGS